MRQFLEKLMKNYPKNIKLFWENFEIIRRNYKIYFNIFKQSILDFFWKLPVFVCSFPDYQDVKALQGPFANKMFTSVYAASAGEQFNKEILKTMLLWTSRSVQGTKENCYFGLQVSVLNPNSLCTPYASTCP